jgi:hypothetical protein
MKPTREMTMGAGIFCAVCGARPYPELGQPETREDFDLMRLDRKVAAASRSKNDSRRAVRSSSLKRRRRGERAR